MLKTRITTFILLLFMKCSFGQQVICGGYTYPKNDSLDNIWEQRQIAFLADSTKSIFKLKITDNLAPQNKEDDRSVPFAQVKIINLKNDTIIKQTDYDGECVFKIEKGVYNIEVNYINYKYIDTIELKYGFYNKLYLQCDWVNNKTISINRKATEYSKVDFNKE